VVRANETLDVGNIRLDPGDYDAPGIVYFCLDSRCSKDILFQREVIVPKGCGVDLDKGRVSCSNFARSDIRFLDNGQGRLVLRGANKATIGVTADSTKAEEFDINDLGRGDDFWVLTKRRQKAHVYLELKDVAPDTNELILWVTTRKKIK
jgi:hypothetical protein